MNSEPLILALDYGGTKLTAAAIHAKDLEGRQWLGLERVFSPPGHDAQWEQAAMLTLARKLLERTPGKLAAVGVSFGGPVDARAGMVRLSHHMPGWENTPLAKLLQQEFKVPVAIENDANLGGLGEWRLGAGQGCGSLFYVTISTGIGGGWVIDGHIWGGADGMAGEIGHNVVRPGGAPCACGKRGCVEAEASGQAIARKMRQRVGENSAAEFTGESVARAAQAGDAQAHGSARRCRRDARRRPGRRHQPDESAARGAGRRRDQVR